MNLDNSTIIHRITTPSLSSPLCLCASVRASSSLLFLLLLCLVSCQAQQQKHSLIDFYEGLKKSQADAKTEAVAYFEKALDSPNIHIAAAASLELMSLRYSGTAIKPETISKIRKKAPAMTASKASGTWAMALDALGTGQDGSGPDREKILTLALNNESRSPDEAIQYLLLELRALGADAPSAAAGDSAAGNDSINIFSNAENAAIAGRIAVSRSRYREALVFFRMVMADAPGLFFQYPELLSDLGRSFQYTASSSATGREGMNLFLQWEKDLDEKKINIKEENLNALIRFRLLFYAARIARQRGFPESVELFERALPWVLSLNRQTGGAASTVINDEQTDACIWYILNTSLAQDAAQGGGRTIRYLEKYIVHWRDDSYYLDVMDKLARGLLLKRQWTDIINIFAITKNRKGVIGAKFAWITGRAVQEGLLSQREMELVHKALAGAPQEGYSMDNLAEACFRIAYNNAASSDALAPGALAPGALAPLDGKALYYRSLSAAALAEPFLILQTAEPTEAASKEPAPPKAAVSKKAAAAQPQADTPVESDAMEFLLGFFNNGAAKFAPRYIKMMESDLSPEELRRLAEALGNGGAPNGAAQYQESMRLVSLYTRQDSYQLVRRDLELLYPRPFNEQVIQYARETGIGSAKLYALIRTESAFNPDAISRSGAIGLTQLMPATAEEMAARILRRGGPDYRKTDKDSAAAGAYSGATNGDEISGDTDSGAASGAAGKALIASEVGVDLLDPGANIHMGAAYLAYLEERLGDPLLAILAYNGGMNRVRRWRNSLPVRFPSDLFLETIEYAETMDYGRSVMGAAAMYRALY